MMLNQTLLLIHDLILSWKFQFFWYRAQQVSLRVVKLNFNFHFLSYLNLLYISLVNDLHISFCTPNYFHVFLLCCCCSDRGEWAAKPLLHSIYIFFVFSVFVFDPLFLYTFSFLHRTLIQVENIQQHKNSTKCEKIYFQPSS